MGSNLTGLLVKGPRVLPEAGLGRLRGYLEFLSALDDHICGHGEDEDKLQEFLHGLQLGDEYKFSYQLALELVGHEHEYLLRDLPLLDALVVFWDNGSEDSYCRADPDDVDQTLVFCVGSEYDDEGFNGTGYRLLSALLRSGGAHFVGIR